MMTVMNPKNQYQKALLLLSLLGNYYFSTTRTIQMVNGFLQLQLPSLSQFTIHNHVTNSRHNINNMVASPIESSSITSSSSSSASSGLEETDRELFDLIEKEDKRQKYGLELIASENFASASVRQTLGSCLTNKYSEGNGKFV